MALSLSTSPDELTSWLGAKGELTCDGALSDGRAYRVAGGDLKVDDGTGSLRDPNPVERTEVLDFLRGELKNGQVREAPDGTILFIKKSRAAAAAGAVGDALSSVRKKVEKARRNDEQEVRAWGMVSMARAHFESKTPEPSSAEVVDFLKTQFTADFNGNEDDLELFAEEAVKLAKNKVKNTESATRVVARLKLAEEIADRLGKMGKEADIRVALSADSKVKTFKNKNGTEIHRAKAEVEEILDIAFAKAKVLFAAKAKEKAGSFNLRARDLEMVSLVRFLKDDGYLEDDIREKLKLEFDGEENLAQLIDAAWNGASNTEHNKNAAARMVDKRKFGADVAQRLARGEKEKDVRDTILAEVDEMTLPKSGKIKRSTEEKEEIWTAALAEAKKLQAKEKTNEGELIETAHKEGMVVRARSYLKVPKPISVDEAKEKLIAEFPGARAKALAEVAVKEAMDDRKYVQRLALYAKEEKLAERILEERKADKTGKVKLDKDIKKDIRRDHKEFKGRTRLPADLETMLDSAFDQASILEKAREKEAKAEKVKSHAKSKSKGKFPWKAESKWDEEMTDRGIFRWARLQKQNRKGKDDEIRAELEVKFALEKDPEAMAVYVMEQVEDPAFNRKQAEQVVFLRSLDQIAKESIKAGKKDVDADGKKIKDLEDDVRAKLKGNPEKHLGLKSGEKIEDTLSNEELDEIIQAAIRKAKNVKEWEDNGEAAKAWLKSDGWDLTKKGLKYGAVGAAVLGLGTAALGLVGSAAALTLGWKGIKLVGRGIGTAAAYGLPMMGEAARAGVNVAGAGLKFARNTLLYAPASMIATPMVRTYQAAKVAVNYPDQANYQKPEIKKPANKEAKGWTTPFTWMANGFRSTTTGIGNLFRRTTTGTANLFRGGWRKTKQAGLLAAALLTAPVVGLGEGAAIGVGHHIAGAEWHGSKTIDAFMEENGKPHAAPAAAPAANGKDHGHDKVHAKKDH